MRVSEVARIDDKEHFDKLFLALMVRRMTLKRPNLAVEDPVEKILDHMDQYVRTGNTAFLIEAGNYIWAEFMQPNHPAAHFSPLQDTNDGTT